jgi:hypothetical protein
MDEESIEARRALRKSVAATAMSNAKPAAHSAGPVEVVFGTRFTSLVAVAAVPVDGALVGTGLVISAPPWTPSISSVVGLWPLWLP